MSSAIWTQLQHRGRNDDGGQVSASWSTALDGDLTLQADVRFRWRFTVGCSGKAGTLDPKLRYSLNGGAYTDALGTNAVHPSDSPYLTDDEATTKQLYTGGGTFYAGYVDDTDGSMTNIDVASGGVTEVEFSIIIDGAQVSAGNTIELRVYDGNSALDAYTDWPVITIGTGESTATASVGVLTITGQTPTPQLTHAAYPTIGLEALAGYAPTVESLVGANLAEPTDGLLSIAGYAPTAVSLAEFTTAPTVGTDTITGYAPTWEVINDLQPSYGLETLTGYAPTWEVINDLYPSNGLEALLGNASALEIINDVLAAAGLETLSGYAPTASGEDITELAPSVGVLTTTGYTASQEVINDIRPVAGLETMLGQQPSSALEVGLAPEAALLSTTGYAASQEVINDLRPTSGLEALLGNASALEVINDLRPSNGLETLLGETPAVGATGSLRPDSSLNTLSGYGAALEVINSLRPTSALLSTTGYAPTLPSDQLNAVINISGNAPALEIINDEYPARASLAITGKAPVSALVADVAPAMGELSLVTETPLSALETHLAPAVGLVSIVGAIQTVAEIAFPPIGMLDVASYEPSADIFTEEYVTPDEGIIDLVALEPTPRLIAELVPTTGRIGYTSTQQVVDHGFFTYPLACVLTVTRNTVIGTVNVDPWVPQADGSGIWTAVPSVKRRDIDFR